jgi:hypothetical protein
MSDRYAALVKEEAKWTSIKSKLESGEFDMLNKVMEALNEDSGVVINDDELLDMSEVGSLSEKVTKVRAGIETIALALDERTAQVHMQKGGRKR